MSYLVFNFFVRFVILVFIQISIISLVIFGKFGLDSQICVSTINTFVIEWSASIKNTINKCQESKTLKILSLFWKPKNKCCNECISPRNIRSAFHFAVQKAKVMLIKRYFLLCYTFASFFGPCRFRRAVFILR